jgi:hypothetical protein
MMDTMQIKSMEDIIKNLETLQYVMIIKEIIHVVFRKHVIIRKHVVNRKHVVLKIETIINLIVTTMIVRQFVRMIVSQTQSQSIKEETINITIRNLNIELKIVNKTKDKKEVILETQMKKVKCLMKAIGNLKIYKLEMLMISKEKNQIDLETMMIDIKISTTSKGL